MKKDYSLLLYALVIAIAVGVSMCGHSEPQVNPEITVHVPSEKYPYEWAADSIVYNRIICYNHNNGSSAVMSGLTIKFNEEFIEVGGPIDPVIFVGKWDAHQVFIIDNDLGSIQVNPLTGNTTIYHANGDKDFFRK